MSLRACTTLALAAGLAGCTTIIREEADQDPGATPMTTVDPSGGDGTSQGESTGATEGGSSEGTSTSTSGGEGEGSSSSGFGGGAQCGNGIIEGAEDCDCGEGNVCAEKELGGIGCVALGTHPDVPGPLTGGVLLCSATSCRYDIANCFWCGDGLVNGNETCEPGTDLDTSCGELGLGLGEVSCGDGCQIDTSGCNACGFIYDFDDGDCPGAWTTGRTTDAAAEPTWECGSAGGYEGGPGFSPSLMWATDLSGPYQGNESGYFASPAIDFTACTDQSITMTVRHWFSLEVNDGGVVQVSVADPEDEASWTTIEPVAGSFYSATVAANHPPVAGNPAFSTFDAAEGTWVNAEFDLSAFAGEQSVHVRFVFGSDDGGASGGWYVDEISILGTPR